MSDKKIKKRLINEFESETPDVLNNILLNCKEKENIMEKKNKRSLFLPLSMAFATFLLVFGGLLYSGYNSGYKESAIIELDVNPSVEIKINNKDQITEVIALNEDAKTILKNMNLKNSDLNVGVNAIIISMLDEGYISEFKNSILVSVDSQNEKKSSRIQKTVSDEINKILQGHSIESSVVTHSYDEEDNEIAKKAVAHNISKGKAEYIDRILEVGLTNKNGEEYTFDTLSKLSINELIAILNSKNTTVNNTTSIGSASTKGYIGINKAKEIAINDAKVNNTSITNMEVELDFENGRMIYEVSFDELNKEYEYEIDAITGEVIKREIEKDDDYVVKDANQPKPSKTDSQRIGKDKAKEIAINDSKVPSLYVNELKVEIDFENGKEVYEVSFKYNGYEYEYEIDAKAGNIIDKRVERDD